MSLSHIRPITTGEVIRLCRHDSGVHIGVHRCPYWGLTAVPLGGSQKQKETRQLSEIINEELPR